MPSTSDYSSAQPSAILGDCVKYVTTLASGGGGVDCTSSFISPAAIVSAWCRRGAPLATTLHIASKARACSPHGDSGDARRPGRRAKTGVIIVYNPDRWRARAGGRVATLHRYSSEVRSPSRTDAKTFRNEQVIIADSPWRVAYVRHTCATCVCHVCMR